MDVLTSTGPWLYPLAALALALLLSVGRAIQVIRSGNPIPPAGPPHHAVVAWGALGALVGLLGSLVGIARLAAGLAGVVGPDSVDAARVLDILEEGALVAASPAAMGLGLFALSVLCWLLLGFVLNRRLLPGD